METHASHDSPALGILVVTVAAMVLGMGIVAVQEWTPLADTQEKIVRSASAPESTPAASECRQCGVIESVRSIEKAEIAASGVTIRGFGDDLMSVLGVVAGALAGNRLSREAGATTIHEITVRFEDGSSRVLRSAGARKWERGDRVKVIQGRVHPNS